MWGLQACFLRAPHRFPCPPTWSLRVRLRPREGQEEAGSSRLAGVRLGCGL